MNPSAIEWTDFTVNPLRARLGPNEGHYCEKISDGCKNCYSSALQPVYFKMPGFPEQQRQRRDIEPILSQGVLAKVLRRKKPARVFWCDMTDIFGSWVSDEWLDQIFAVMAITPHLTHQVLTKRIDRGRAYLSDPERPLKIGRAVMERGESVPFVPPLRLVNPRPLDFLATEGDAMTVDWPMPHVHVGVSAENQKAFDARVGDLLETPAAVHFLSLEPLLGPIEFGGYVPDYPTNSPDWTPDDCRSGIGGIIVGGESGPRARPCHVQWIRRIVQQCRAGLVPCFVKQLGSKPVVQRDGALLLAGGYGVDFEEVRYLDLRHGKGGDPSEWPEDLRVREFPA